MRDCFIALHDRKPNANVGLATVVVGAQHDGPRPRDCPADGTFSLRNGLFCGVQVGCGSLASSPLGRGLVRSRPTVAGKPQVDSICLHGEMPPQIKADGQLSYSPGQQGKEGNSRMQVHPGSNSNALDLRHFSPGGPFDLPRATFCGLARLRLSQ